MVMINCDECAELISSLAVACPKCGRPDPHLNKVRHCQECGTKCLLLEHESCPECGCPLTLDTPSANLEPSPKNTRERTLDEREELLSRLEKCMDENKKYEEFSKNDVFSDISGEGCGCFVASIIVILIVDWILTKLEAPSTWFEKFSGFIIIFAILVGVLRVISKIFENKRWKTQAEEKAEEIKYIKKMLRSKNED